MGPKKKKPVAVDVDHPVGGAKDNPKGTRSRRSTSTRRLADHPASKPTRAVSKPRKVEAESEESEAKPRRAVAKPTKAAPDKPLRADSKPRTVAAKPDESTAKPSRAASKPMTVAAKPDESTAKPSRTASKSRKTEVEPEQETVQAEDTSVEPVRYCSRSRKATKPDDTYAKYLKVTAKSRKAAPKPNDTDNPIKAAAKSRKAAAPTSDVAHFTSPKLDKTASEQSNAAATTHVASRPARSKSHTESDPLIRSKPVAEKQQFPTPLMSKSKSSKLQQLISEKEDDLELTEVMIGPRRKRRIQDESEVESSPSKRPHVVQDTTQKSKTVMETSNPTSESLPPFRGRKSVSRAEPEESRKKARFTALPEKSTGFSTLSTNLEKLKEKAKLQTKKSLCSKDILSLLEDIQPASSVPENTAVTIEGRRRKAGGVETEAESSKPQTRVTDGKGAAKAGKVVSNENKDNAETFTSVRRRRNVPQPDMSENRTVSLRKSLVPRVTETSVNQSSLVQNSSLSKHIPIWKKANISQVGEGSKKDVFDPNCYGEEEFGPEDERVKMKKKTRRKKKDTKAILVFGNQAAKKDIEKAVKESHHLRTPGVTRKKPVPVPKVIVSEFRSPKGAGSNRGEKKKDPSAARTIQPAFIPAISSTVRSNQSKLGYSSDFSLGAHNYFDSVNAGCVEVSGHQVRGVELSIQSYHQGGTVQQNLSHVTQDLGSSLISEPPETIDHPAKSYTTPSVPKTFSKLLKNDKSSTPKLDSGKPKQPETIKDQIKNAFGFDDTDEDELSGSESMISPVKTISRQGASILEVTNRHPSMSRMTSTLNSFREPGEPEQRTAGPYRFTAVPSKSGILKQVAALEREKINQTIAKHLKSQKKPSRSSPRKKSQQFRVEEQVEQELRSDRVPLLERTKPLAEPVPPEEMPLSREEENLPEPECLQKSEARNAFEVLKSAKTSNKPVKVKKLTKKAPKNKKLEQSSICDSLSSSIVNKINGTGAVRKKANQKAKVLKSKSPKKSSDKENTSQELNITRGSVSRTYKPNKKEKPSVSFDQSIPSSPTKKPTQKEKKLNAWAALQTSHFSEVEEFDLSFA